MNNRSRGLGLPLLLAIYLVAGLLPAQLPGEIDGAFGTAGWLTLDLDRQDRLLKMEPGTGGRTLALCAANDSLQRGWQGKLVAIDGGGLLDANYGTGGMASLVVPGVPALNVEDLAVDGNGAAYVLAGGVDSGLALRPLCVLKLDATGNPDSSFGQNGVVKVGFSQMHATPYALVLQTDGKIVAVGMGTDSAMAFQKLPIICRLNTDGGVDSSLGGTGRMFVNYQFGPMPIRTAHGNGGAFQDVEIMPDGRILCVGDASGFANFKASMVMLQPDGALDSSFFGNGIHLWDINPGYHSGIDAVKALDNTHIAVLPEFDPGLFSADYYYSPGIAGQVLGFPLAFGLGGYRESASVMTNDNLGFSYLCGRSANDLIAPMHVSHRFSVVRVGSLGGIVDTLYADRGWFNHEFDNDRVAEATTMAVHPDGKLIVGGHAGPGSDTTKTDILITRLHAGLPLARNPEAQTSSFRLWPVPSTECVHVQGKRSRLEVSVYNPAGQEVVRQHSADGEIHVDTGGWPAGLYLFVVQQGGNRDVIRVPHR